MMFTMIHTRILLDYMLYVLDKEFSSIDYLVSNQSQAIMIYFTICNCKMCCNPYHPYFSALRSGQIGIQCEAVVKFPRLFEKYPFPILINSAMLKIADVFRVG